MAVLLIKASAGVGLLVLVSGMLLKISWSGSSAQRLDQWRSGNVRSRGCYHKAVHVVVKQAWAATPTTPTWTNHFRLKYLWMGWPHHWAFSTPPWSNSICLHCKVTIEDSKVLRLGRWGASSGNSALFKKKRRPCIQESVVKVVWYSDGRYFSWRSTSPMLKGGTVWTHKKMIVTIYRKEMKNISWRCVRLVSQKHWYAPRGLILFV